MMHTDNREAHFRIIDWSAAPMVLYLPQADALVPLAMNEGGVHLVESLGVPWLIMDAKGKCHWLTREASGGPKCGMPKAIRLLVERRKAECAKSYRYHRREMQSLARQIKRLP
ncbi:MAG TPA: hypothetical protein VFF76_09685 [Holophagaceae bacterium]|jgi:hypothetical protein|nr:hypothetical protein [Holophagaceae bacterium]